MLQPTSVNIQIRALDGFNTMSVTEAKRNNEECRVEDGIYFPDDYVILLSGSPRDGYAASGRLKLSSLLEADPEGWTEIVEHVACRVEVSGVIVAAGEGAWEAEGFVAALRVSDGALLWVLHLRESEAFRQVRHDGQVIWAVSSEYPDEYQWRIPINAPEELSVVAHRAI